MSYDTYIQQMVTEMELRGCSPITIRNYRYSLHSFFEFTKKSVTELTSDDVKDYLHFLIKKNFSRGYINCNHSCFKFFFVNVLRDRRLMEDVPRMKKDRKLPNVLSKAEVKAIIDATSNMKHKAILMTIYSAGLRASEVVNLKITDIDSSNMQIHIRDSKGNKDRYALLSEKVLLYLREYFKVYRPTDWLFYSSNERSKHLSVRTVQVTFKSSAAKVGITKKVSVHTLRHSFATHLLINDTNLFTIKTLLGHNSIQSTQVYLHLAPGQIYSVKSPFDQEVSDNE